MGGSASLRQVLRQSHLARTEDLPEMISAVAPAMGTTIRYDAISSREYRRNLLAAGFDHTYVRVQLLINAVARIGLAAWITDTIPTLLHRPATVWAGFIADHAAEWRQPTAIS